MGSRPWPFGVTWRYRSRDRSTPGGPGGRLPMGCPQWPCVHLAPLPRYGASKIMGSRPWPFGSRDVIVHVTVRLPRSTSYGWSIVTMRLFCTVEEIWRLKDNGITTLTFRGPVTSSVMWSFDLRWSTSYGCSIATMHLSGIVMEMWRLKVHVHKHTHNDGHNNRQNDQSHNLLQCSLRLHLAEIKMQIYLYWWMCAIRLWALRHWRVAW